MSQEVAVNPKVLWGCSASSINVIMHESTIRKKHGRSGRKKTTGTMLCGRMNQKFNQKLTLSLNKDPYGSCKGQS